MVLFRKQFLRVWTCSGEWSNAIIPTKGIVKQAFWSPDNSKVLFSCFEDETIYCLSETMTNLVIDKFSEHHEQEVDVGNEHIVLGGSVDIFALDPKGKRLVVSFSNQNPGSELLCALQCQTHPFWKSFA
jgi:WD40 repeat protein